MRKLVLYITVMAIMLSFGSVFFVSTFNLGHTFDEHGVTIGMTDCPFMSHEETICPMTALDHLTILRSIFETVLPSIVTLSLIIGIALVVYFYNTKLKPLFRFHTNTFLQWRASVTYCFSYRLYQDLFSRGVLNPKLF